MSHLIHSDLDAYLRRCYTYPGAKTKFAAFRAAFTATLTPRQQREWPRRRLLEELARYYVIGADSAGTLYIGGLSLSPPPRYENVGGRLTLTSG